MFSKAVGLLEQVGLNVTTELPNGGVEYTSGMKNRDFRPMSRFISEMIQDRALVTMECE